MRIHSALQLITWSGLLLRPSFRRHAGALIVCPVVFCFLLLRAERFNGLNAEKAGLDVDV